ncbi:hypothetical protein [Palaeococcus sp. (in: euryarchaeotes)]|uniref:hypothetical protein n=1 Tax=Palaeococcus sp. (in: euryarchaeotes) TaxID=2820298 RepID=UPI0025EA6C1B|nr:hypothetical protein [Palaeococcus sp. (in: euryarchaeotes)]MCD6559932.1 hypothetical protein [Palaeococcus sp. (in: euryarchaeotes)]
MGKLEDLKNNIGEYFKSAELLFKEGLTNAAFMMYFKTLVTIADYTLWRDLRVLPDNHRERFRLLKPRYPDLYNVLSYYFPYYRDTYTRKVDERLLIAVRSDVIRLKEKVE